MPPTIPSDDWDKVQNQLLDEGWLIYQLNRYDPTVIRGYTTAFLTGSPATRRKANRPCFVSLHRTTPNPDDPWEGTMSLAASTLWPWVPNATMPPDDADWATGPGSHYTDPVTWEVNPVVWDELAAAEFSPVVTLSRQYPRCDYPASNAITAIRDLFTRIVYPA